MLCWASDQMLSSLRTSNMLRASLLTGIIFLHMCMMSVLVSVCDCSCVYPSVCTCACVCVCVCLDRHER